MQRIELLARDHGLPLFAKLAPRDAARDGEWLLVLGSDAEHTPVLQAAPAGQGSAEALYLRGRGFEGRVAANPRPMTIGSRAS